MKPKIPPLVALLLAVGAASSDVRNFASLEDLPLDSEGALAEHLLVVAHGNQCQAESDLLKAQWHQAGESSTIQAERRLATASGELAAALHLDGGCARAVCLERGTPIPSVPFYNKGFDQQEFADKHGRPPGHLWNDFQEWFMPECQSAEIGFISYHPRTLSVKWVNPDTGERMDQGPLEYGERHTAWRVSYLGHVFELHDPAGHAADPANVPLVYGTYPVKYNSFYALGTFSPPPLPDAAAVARKERQIESTVKFEFERSRSVQRTFTSTGFDRRPLADVDPWIWGSIRAYYNNNRVHGAAREEWDDKGLYVNWWEFEPQVIQMPWGLKTMWHERLKGLVEEWAQSGPLESTDIYGIRVYHEGARLLSHVDRFETHAASLIVNVDQRGVDLASSHPSWPVEILDLADHLHEVEMAPGDIVYYESARCLHARTQPLASGSYANLFVHYRPEGNPDWWRAAHPGAPPPVTRGDHRAAQAELNATLAGLAEAGTAAAAHLLLVAGAGGKLTRHGALAKKRGEKGGGSAAAHGGHRVHLEPIASPESLFAHWTSTRSPLLEPHDEF